MFSLSTCALEPGVGQGSKREEEGKEGKFAPPQGKWVLGKKVVSEAKAVLFQLTQSAREEETKCAKCTDSMDRLTAFPWKMQLQLYHVCSLSFLNGFIRGNHKLLLYA